MKKVSIILIFFLFIFHAFSQKTKVQESSEKIAGGKNNSLVVLIRECNEKDVEKEWVSLMKKNKAKVSSKKEIFADDAILPLISSNTVDVYAIIEQIDNDVKFIVAFDLGGAFLNSKDHNANFRAAERMIYDFAIKISKQSVQKVIAVEQKKMSDFERKKENLKKDIQKKEKEIADYKKKIEDNEMDIIKNNSDLESLDKVMKEHKIVIEALEKKFKAID